MANNLIFQHADTNFDAPQFYFDIKINTKEKVSFYFCRFLLIRCSKYFEKMLCSNFQENQTNEINLEYSKTTVLSLLKYLNTFDNEEKKKTIIDINNVLNLLEISHALGIQELSVRCIRSIVNNIEKISDKYHWKTIVEILILYNELIDPIDTKTINIYYAKNLDRFKQYYLA
jgi:hypothetical protein